MTRWLLFVFGMVGTSWHVGGQQNTQDALHEAALNESSYDSHTMMRIFPMNDKEMKMVQNFKDPLNEIEVLKMSRGINDSLDILVPPSRLQFVDKMFVDSSTMWLQKRENYGRRFESVERTPRRRGMGHYDIFAYHSFQQMNEYIAQMARAHADLVRVQYLGDSYQGRPISLVKISADPSARNPVIFVDAGIHAREWVAPAMAMYLIHRMATDPHARRAILKGVDWHILPVVNPDGYEFTRSSRNNRMWRKTRSKHGFCYGVDGNRNYGFKWAVSGVSKDPCDKETYAGPEPFSEPETRLVRNAMRESAKRMKLYVSLHSYGQYLVYPWGYTGSLLPKTWEKLDNLAKVVSNAVQRAGGLPFKVLSAGKWYPAAGGSDDYAFGAIGVPYSYTMELTDGHEFIFPENLLSKVLPEFYAGFEEFAVQIRREFGENRRHGKLVANHTSSLVSNETDSHPTILVDA